MSTGLSHLVEKVMGKLKKEKLPQVAKSKLKISILPSFILGLHVSTGKVPTESF